MTWLRPTAIWILNSNIPNPFDEVLLVANPGHVQGQWGWDNTLEELAVYHIATWCGEGGRCQSLDPELHRLQGLGAVQKAVPSTPGDREAHGSSAVLSLTREHQHPWLALTGAVCRSLANVRKSQWCKAQGYWSERNWSGFSRPSIYWTNSDLLQ